MKRIFGTLAFLSFFWLLGTVAAVEQDMMALGTGTLHMAFTLFLFYVFCKLAGAFYPTQKRKSRRRECSPIHGKRKSSI
jgi:hypothetical protein